MVADLGALEPIDKETGALQMVVECPRGASVKLKYDDARRIFTVSHALALGITYPFDWGFVPGTLGDDGDPLDALAIHDTATYPGVVLPCRLLGMVDVIQNDGAGKESNPRLILVPTWHDRLGELEKVAGLPRRLRQEIEQFFLSATFFTGKEVRVRGWHGRKRAQKVLRAGMQKFSPRP